MKYMWIDIDESLLNEIRHEIRIGGRTCPTAHKQLRLLKWDVGQSELIQELLK